MTFPPDSVLQQLRLGPQPLAREARWQTLNEIVAAVEAQHGPAALAIGLYGSTARGSDAAYSDIELLCVLDTQDDDYTYEWVYGPSKAEVNFQSLPVAQALAAELDEAWALTHGAYVHARCLHGNPNVLLQLRQAARAHSHAAFDAVIAEIIIGDIYELMGKLRNARLSGLAGYAPALACKMIQQAALMLGLAHRRHYTTAGTLLAESLALPNRPGGYDALAARVMRGDLAQAAAVSAEMEALWAGIVDWAGANQVGLEARCRDPFK